MNKNILAKTYPQIAEQWHPTKNEGLLPEFVTAGSDKKVWWQCLNTKDHIWEASIGDRTRGRGCPFCAGKKVAKSNCLATTHPKIAEQWHPTKNGALTPFNVIAGSKKAVWWKCPRGNDHEWEEPLVDRSNKKINCRFCNWRKLSITNCLQTIDPDLSKEWHPNKNGELTPKDIISGSGEKAWWKCSKNHEWEASPASRRKNSGCPYCGGRKIDRSNCLATTDQALAKEWNYTKNKGLAPENVHIGSSKKVWWKCRKCNEEWQAVIYSRKNGSGCPNCAGKKVNKINSLANIHPELIEEWHQTKNGEFNPENFHHKSGKKVWWKCKKCNEEWEASIEKRANGRGCPYCRGLKVGGSNCLANKNHELAKEWHPTKNILTPFEVTSGTSKKIWWKCSKDTSHEWQASVAERNGRNRGCPQCNSGWTIDNIRLFVKSIKENINALTPAELYILFQQSGLLSIYGKAKPFIEALKTGKFPKEEIEKFCKGEASLVDDIINDSSNKLENFQEENIQELEVSNAELNREILEKELPLIETRDVLAALNNKVFSSADEEAIDFFITSGCAKIWKHIFINEEGAYNQAKTFRGGEYPERVKKLFFEEYEGAKNLKIPNGYSFKMEGKPVEPNLMQRLAAYRVKKYKRQGNWSGTGAGKTLSAILASRLINAKLTVICCPNSVVEGWGNNISATYPNSVVHGKTLNPTIDQSDGKNHYLILNYEAFQQENSEALVKRLTENYRIDFIVIDEIHFSKQRVVEDMSKRKKMIMGLISHGGEKNSDLHVFGMSATPVINNLYEGVSLLEMITGLKYDDLNTKPTVNNCMALYQRLTTIGIRWLPQYEQKLNVKKIDINCDDFIDEIRKLGMKSTMLDLEKILTRARLPEIKKHIKSKTLIYTHYVEEICQTLKEEIEKDGWKVAFFTGEDKSGLKRFIEGDIDVLIGSSAIGTGIDGLQNVCSRLIVNILPWTHAEFEQLKGRIYRQGQKATEVDIIIPLTHAEVNGENWSWCDSKWKRIQFKKSIADASVDGVVPEGHLRSPAQAYQDTMNWIKRLEEGKISEIQRRKIHIPLSDTTIRSRERKYGDFSAMNQRINHASSQTTHGRFEKDPKEWEQYHALYREARKEWPITPYEEMITWCKARPNLIIGDFGCGEAKMAEALENTVYSFDHIAVNENVIACDMSHVSLDNTSLDVAIFSLSLMGSNFTDYIKEAHRCLKLDGHLWIIESTSRFSELKQFTKGLEKLGFDIVIVEEKYKFTFIRCLKSDRKIQDILLKF